MGKCLMCGKELHKVLFSNDLVKIYICSEKCLKDYWKPIRGFRLWIQKRFREREEWLDETCSLATIGLFNFGQNDKASLANISRRDNEPQDFGRDIRARCNSTKWRVAV